MAKIVWVLIDSRAGSNGQARGVARVIKETLGWEIIEKNIEYNHWSDLPNFLLGSFLWGVKKSSRPVLNGPFPDLLISASRRTVAPALWIQKKSCGKTKVIQLMHPGNAGLAKFDRVFVADHDRHKKKSPNICYVVGSAHRFTAPALVEYKQKWQEKFAGLPRPLTAVIIGGAIKNHVFSMENARELALAVKKYKQKSGGSILITTSRRTGKESQDLIMNELKGIPAYTYLWGVDKGENPYPGFVACADDMIVTGDSVSMCCEVCGSGKKVMVFTGEDWLTPKHIRFVNSLYRNKLAFPLGTEVSEETELKSYNAADVIVEEIKKLF